MILDAAGRYFASFVVETGEDPLPGVGAEVGIDLGLTHFAVLSGRTFAKIGRWSRHRRCAQRAG